MGARYLDPKYSRWISSDPALGEYVPQAPVNDDAKKHNQNLPGMGGLFNSVNGNLYHYAGNNPVRYVDPDGKAVVSLNQKNNSSLEKIIQSVCGSDFYFDGNELRCRQNMSNDKIYSPTARNLLLAAINSEKTAYMYAYTPEEELPITSEEAEGLYGELGFSRRVSGDENSAIAFFMIDIKEAYPQTGTTASYLMSMFSCSIDEANSLGFIHEFLGHVLCDLSIAGYSPDTDIMKSIEIKIRGELKWKFATRLLDSEFADLSGHEYSLENLK